MNHRRANANRAVNRQYRVIENCLCCNATFLYPYLDLGQQPPCNAFHNEQEPAPQEFPVEVMRCGVCQHSQLSITVDPDILFKDYLYRTGVSNTLINHYTELAKNILVNQLPRVQPTRLTPTIRVLDIGCNDGTLLNGFKKSTSMNIETWGVDPCFVGDQRTKKLLGVDYFMEGLWDDKLIAHYQLKPGFFDIITATNVLAHNDNPKEFLRLTREVVKENGLVIIEFPYARNLLYQCQFDTIYHEHISYFLVGPVIKLLKGTGLTIMDCSLLGVHGGSLRLALRPCLWGTESSHLCSEIRQLEAKEKELGLNRPEFFEGFQWKVDDLKKRLIHEVDAAVKEHDGMLIGFGASGKSSVILNYSEITPELLLDETPSKIGLLSPGMDIRIVHPEAIENYNEPCVFLIMSWNCMEESLTKLRRYRQNNEYNEQDIVVTYIPEVKSFNLFTMETLQGAVDDVQD